MSTPDSLPQLRLFFSYSHKDSDLRRELDVHLALLKREGLIEGWYDRKIVAGDEWDQELNKNFEAADVILLLISADFLASKYCFEKEMNRAMEKHLAGEAVVIPIILREADWKSATFSKFQALPKDLKPVTSWSNRDEAWANVAAGIRRAIEKLQIEVEQQAALLETMKPKRFDKKIIELEDYRSGAEILLDMVDRRDTFDPDIIIAVNQGGMVVAAVMNKRWRKPVGVISIASKKGKKVIKNVSLPCEVVSLATSAGPTIELQPSEPKNILVVDPKLKSGDSAERIQELLVQAYGKDVEIQFAIVLGCGGWKTSRWRVMYQSAYAWPILFRPKNLEVFIAYYTDSDQVDEEVRSGVRIPPARSQQ